MWEKKITLDAPKPICGVLDVNCSPIKTDVYVDRKLIGQTPLIYSEILIGEHELRLSKEGYLPIVKRIVVKENEILSVKETLTHSQDKTKAQAKVEEQAKAKAETGDGLESRVFASLNYSYSNMSRSAVGLTFGQLKKFGWYVSAMTGLESEAKSAVMECDENFRVDGHLPFYTADYTASRLSLTAGMMYRVAKPLSVKLGAGYGQRLLAWELEGGGYVRDASRSYKGLELDAGVQLFLGRFNLSLDYVNTSLKCSEVKIGLGINIK